MESEIEKNINNIKKAAERIKKKYNQRDVLVNMRYEKPVGSSVIHVSTLAKICLLTYKGTPLKEAINEVLNEIYKGIGKGTLNAYRNDYRLFFRIMSKNMTEAEV
jgi:hypothetical protein